MVPFVALLLATADPAGASAAAASINPRANELFERDPALKAWAVRIYDRNHDGWLTLFEAQPALAAFKGLADSNHDGRVTTREYEAAIAFIRARY